MYFPKKKKKETKRGHCSPLVMQPVDSLSQYIQAMRLFKEEPKWTPLNRSDELNSNTYRQSYVSEFLA